MQGLKKLLDYVSEFLLRGEDCPDQTRSICQFHDQPAEMFFEVQVQSFILDDVPMGEAFHQHEVVPQFWQVLILEHETFGCVLHSAPFFGTFMYDSI